MTFQLSKSHHQDLDARGDCPASQVQRAREQAEGLGSQVPLACCSVHPIDASCAASHANVVVHAVCSSSNVAVSAVRLAVL